MGKAYSNSEISGIIHTHTHTHTHTYTLLRVFPNFVAADYLTLNSGFKRYPVCPYPQF